MPYVSLKSEVVPPCQIGGPAAPVESGGVSFAPAAEPHPTMEYRLLPHYWDCVEANEWDWGPKGRPLPVSPKNPRAGYFSFDHEVAQKFKLQLSGKMSWAPEPIM